jgi:hypothetical protein
MMGDPIHGDGIFECNGCGRLYSEYINGCVEEHGNPRKVRLIVPDPPGDSGRTGGDRD